MSFDPSVSGSTERRRVLALAALVIALFSVADYRALHHFSWSTTGVRLLWSSGILGVAFASGRVRVQTEQHLFVALGLLTALCRTMLVALAGPQHPNLYWLLAMPLIVAIVVQDHPRATVACAAGVLVGGLWLLGREGRAAGELGTWVVQAAAMGGLAYYGSAAYHALHLREARAGREREEALQRSLELAQERRARAHAEDAVRARDEFLTVASHELRTPLTALLLQAQLAKRLGRREGGMPQDGAVLDSLEGSVGRLVRLVERLLDVSRLRMGRPALELEEVDLSALVREAAARFGPELEQAGCALEVSVANDVVGRWDRVRLEQVIANLLSNAAKFGAGRPVRLELASERGAARLSVADDGIGLAPEDQARIFQRFERAATSEAYAGLGLGLWIVERIVEALGGTITVESEPGRGATFHVVLPTKRASDAPSRASAVATA
jgi:signal transduction histidine kinase